MRLHLPPQTADHLHTEEGEPQPVSFARADVRGSRSLARRLFFLRLFSVHEHERKRRDAEHRSDDREHSGFACGKRGKEPGLEGALDAEKAARAVRDQRDREDREARAKDLEGPARHVRQAGNDLAGADRNRERRQ